MTLGYHIWSNLVHSPVMNEKRLMLIVLCTVCFVLWGTLYLSSILVFLSTCFQCLLCFFTVATLSFWVIGGESGPQKSLVPVISPKRFPEQSEGRQNPNGLKQLTESLPRDGC